MAPRVAIGAIVAATVIAWLLRLSGIDQRTLFWDEAYHLALALEPSLGHTLDAVLRNPPSAPLFAVFIRYWTELVGTSDPLMRLPSTVFGALTVPAAAWLAWEQTASRRVAIAAAFVVALGPYLVEFSQEASLYALATLLATLALASGARWLRTGTRVDWLLAMVTAIVACYSHYVVPVLLAGVALLALTRLGPPRVPRTREVVASIALVGLAWAPWAMPMLGSLAADANARLWLPTRAGLTELGGALSQYTSGTGALLERVRPIQLLGVAAAVVLIARAWMVTGDGRARIVRVLLVICALLFVGPWLMSQLAGRWLFVAHLMLFALPAAAVAAAAGALLPAPATARPRFLGSRRAGALALAGLLVAQAAGLVVNHLYPPHGDDGTREIVAIISAGDADAPLFMTPPESQLVFRHYLDRQVPGLPADVDLRALYPSRDDAADRAESMRRFSELSAGHETAWLLYGDYRDPRGEFLAWLSEAHDVRLELRAQIGDLYWIGLR